MSKILMPLKSGMTTPCVLRCPDRHFRRVIYGIGPYIADYPEQVLITGIVQNWCGRCIAFPDELDDHHPGASRTSELTEAIKEELTDVEAWDEWGIDVHVVVSDIRRFEVSSHTHLCTCSHRHLMMNFPVLIFINSLHLISFTSF
jgi:Plavaka transposase